MNITPTLDKVDKLFHQYINQTSPGCSLAVIKDGEMLYKQGYGFANLELHTPNLPTTVFNIGSMAKQFTAFAIALLEEEGALLLDYDFRKFIPEMHDFGTTITLRNLIHHTSGIRCTFPDLLFLAEWRESDAITMDDVLRLLKAQRDLDFPTGTEYVYANSNYILLALICERVSGMTFREFCMERIFDPLGMTRSSIFDNYMEVIPGRANGYYDDEKGKWFNSPLTDSVIGSTNVYTAVEDLALWDDNFYTGNVGGAGLIERLHQPGHLDDGTESDYAFGLMVGPSHQHRGWEVVEHGGGHGGYVSHMARFPELRLSVVVLFNHFIWGARDYAMKVADLFLEDKSSYPAQAPASKPEVPTELRAELTEKQLKLRTGNYFNLNRAALRDITYKDNHLLYQGLKLVPVSEQRFYFEEEPGTFVEFSNYVESQPERITTITNSGDYIYERVDEFVPTKEELASYTATYYSPEIDIHWKIVLEEDNLVVKRRKFADTILAPLFRDVFSDDWQPIINWEWKYTIIFDRDDDGSVVGLRVSGSRIRNLKFYRQKLPLR